MSGSKLSKGLAEAWARVRAEPAKEGEKPKEFGPPPRANEQRPFVMPADPFAQLRGRPDSEPDEPAAVRDEPEPEPEPASSERATNGVRHEDDQSLALASCWLDNDWGPVS
jgi:cell pole-organizing protein PopZ